ncbi:hypothetical protein Pelo_18467 [Pelomyxa schiedti]|nr:hypothetical protein Pelo_18467 [Pelomyxa schiedti]
MPYRLVIAISEIEELGTCHSVEGLRRNAATGSVERIDRSILLCAEGCILPRIGQSIGIFLLGDRAGEPVDNPNTLPDAGKNASFGAQEDAPVDALDGASHGVSPQAFNTTIDVLVVEKYDVLPRRYTFPGVTELVMRPLPKHHKAEVMVPAPLKPCPPRTAPHWPYVVYSHSTTSTCPLSLEGGGYSRAPPTPVVTGVVNLGSFTKCHREGAREVYVCAIYGCFDGRMLARGSEGEEGIITVNGAERKKHPPGVYQLTGALGASYRPEMKSPYPEGLPHRALSPENLVEQHDAALRVRGVEFVDWTAAVVEHIRDTVCLYSVIFGVRPEDERIVYFNLNTLNHFKGCAKGGTVQLKAGDIILAHGASIGKHPHTQSRSGVVPFSAVDDTSVAVLNPGAPTNRQAEFTELWAQLRQAAIYLHTQSPCCAGSQCW